MNSLRSAGRFGAGLILAASVSLSTFLSPPAQAQVPACLTGDWRVMNLEGTLREVFAGSPDLQVDSIAGDIGLTVRDDGTYELRYVGFALTFLTPNGPVSSTTDGTVRGALRELQPGSVVGTASESAATRTVTAGGTTSTSAVPVQADDQAGAPVTYDCELGQVTFTFSTPGTQRGFSLTFARR